MMLLIFLYNKNRCRLCGLHRFIIFCYITPSSVAFAASWAFSIIPLSSNIVPIVIPANINNTIIVTTNDINVSVAEPVLHVIFPFILPITGTFPPPIPFIMLSDVYKRQLLLE